jgi:hypothetical protein
MELGAARQRIVESVLHHHDDINKLCASIVNRATDGVDIDIKDDYMSFRALVDLAGWHVASEISIVMFELELDKRRELDG